MSSALLPACRRGFSVATASAGPARPAPAPYCSYSSQTPGPPVLNSIPPISSSFPSISRGLVVPALGGYPSLRQLSRRRKNSYKTLSTSGAWSQRRHTSSPCDVNRTVRSFLPLFLARKTPGYLTAGARNFCSSASDMERNSKRKHSPVAGVDRPAKHLKPETSALTPGDSTPANGTVYSIENDADTARAVPLGPAQADSPEWQATIENVVKSVVSIHFCQTCSFDTDLSMASQATGFVVDAEKGYILTNRHVVCAGPFWGYCIFDNHEEVGFFSSPFFP